MTPTEQTRPLGCSMTSIWVEHNWGKTKFDSRFRPGHFSNNDQSGLLIDGNGFTENTNSEICENVYKTRIRPEWIIFKLDQIGNYQIAPKWTIDEFVI